MQELDILLLCVQLLLPAPTAHCTTFAAWALCLNIWVMKFSFLKPSLFRYMIHKDLFETKLKKCAYLKPISSHFFANYMIVFHKTEVQKIILRCLMGLNSNWFNSYDTKHIYFHFRIFAILYKNTHLSFWCFCVLCHNFCTN